MSDNNKIVINDNYIIKKAHYKKEIPQRMRMVRNSDLNQNTNENLIENNEDEDLNDTNQ